jgi:hypothetical protein
MALDRAKVSTDIGLSSQMNYVVSVDYFDSAAPAVILWQEVFNLPFATSTRAAPGARRRPRRRCPQRARRARRRDGSLSRTARP